MINIEIKKGDLLKEKVDAIVNPANATGYMGYGAAKAIVAAGGRQIETEAVAEAPLIIGDALQTTAGSLPFKAVLHTATMDDPNEPLSPANISKAVLGAVLMADDLGYKSVAIPGIGTGLAEVPYKESAKAMINPLKKFVPHSLEKIVFIDLNDEMVDAWKEVLN